MRCNRLLNKKMISIIICSRQKDIPQKLYQNIDKTIGVDYEVIVIDNSKNEYCMCSAYNAGVKRARFPYLCFMHEDIIYMTKDWGMRVIDHLSDTNTGIIGNFGGHYIPDFFPAIYVDGPVTGKFIQGRTINGKYLTNEVDYCNFCKDGSIEVAVVDGMWFCASKSLFDQIRFDDVTFKGFHCYDLDICMQVHAIGKQVKVILDILVEHGSPGNMDIKFYKQLNLWYEKWHANLPMLKGIDESSIPERVKSLESYCVYKSISKLEFQKKWQEVEYSQRYRFGCKIFRVIDFLRGR